MVTCTLYYATAPRIWNTRVRKLINFPLLGAAVLLQGCMTTLVLPSPPPPQIDRLVAANPRPLYLQVIDDRGVAPVGYQYLLVAIPFGQITLDTAAHLIRVLRTQLALSGFALREMGSSPKVVVKIEATELDAFDLLVTRRIRCRVKGTWSKNGHKGRTFEVTHSEYALYAFAPRLSRVFEGCTRELANQITQEVMSRYHPVR